MKQNSWREFENIVTVKRALNIFRVNKFLRAINHPLLISNFCVFVLWHCFQQSPMGVTNRTEPTFRGRRKKGPRKLRQKLLFFVSFLQRYWIINHLQKPPLSYSMFLAVFSPFSPFLENFSLHQKVDECDFSLLFWEPTTKREGLLFVYLEPNLAWRIWYKVEC